MILLCGASASGKTEVARALRVNFGIIRAVTHTTRAPRAGEKNNVDYHFVSKDEFLSLKEKGAFVETTLYNDTFYGCSKAEIADGKCVVVDPNGLKSFQALGNKTIITFFLDAPEEVRKNRMISRGDNNEAIISRLANDRIFFPKGKKLDTDFCINSSVQSVEEITKKVYDLYKQELSKRG